MSEPVITYDPESGMVYVRVAEGRVDFTLQVQAPIGMFATADYDAYGTLLGIEFRKP